jgi:hypothetical protein
MNIRFTSSLTPEDENAFAPVLLNALAGILDLLPIAYMIRIDTSDAKVYQHVGKGSSLIDSTPEAFHARLGRRA